MEPFLHSPLLWKLQPQRQKPCPQCRSFLQTCSSFLISSNSNHNRIDVFACSLLFVQNAPPNPTDSFDQLSLEFKDIGLHVAICPVNTPPPRRPFQCYRSFVFRSCRKALSGRLTGPGCSWMRSTAGRDEAS